MTEYIASALKAARQTKGLSQREVSKRAGVPQSHISNIENGVVDLRVSSLVELARALDLELMLVPRKTVSAVQSIVRQGEHWTAVDSKGTRHAHKELERLTVALHDLPANRLPKDEREQFLRQLRELKNFQLSMSAVEAIRDAYKATRQFSRHQQPIDAVRNSFRNIRTLRNALVHNVSEKEPDSERPAYSLDEDNDG